MDINEAVEMSSRGYGNTMNNAQRVLVDAYIQIVLEQENEGDRGYHWVMEMTDMFQQIMDKL